MKIGCVQFFVICGRIALICNRVQCGSLFWLIVDCPFSFRNVAPWLAVMWKKKIEVYIFGVGDKIEKDVGRGVAIPRRGDE